MFSRIRSRRQARDESNAQPPTNSDLSSSTTSCGLPATAGGTQLAPTLTFGTLFHRSSSTSTGDEDPGLGLRVLHNPEAPSVDVIFVHGLGGHSSKTWSKKHDPKLFWPQLWLPFEPEMGTARILTFGYNANWHDSSNTAARIEDFAKALLYEIRFAQDGSGKSLGIGSHPLLFVAHSMGGLVVKKLVLLGIHDETYKDLIASVSAIIFLSTPHRGTHLAETLNRLLAASFQSPKNFVSDLEKCSPVISDLNEQFRHFATRFSIWSFYETLATTIGPKKMMVLEKDSSVLGYPTEISKPLNADHHDVCKYSSPSDNNYINVRNAIRSHVLLYRRTDREESKSDLETEDIQELFSDCPSSDGDYNTLQQKLVPGTCEWFVRQPAIKSWIRPSQEPHVAWYHSSPGSGKSMRASFLIKHLTASGSACQFFLFKSSDAAKRSVANCLRSLACQLARDLPAFKNSLHTASPHSLGSGSPEPLLLWQDIFERRLFQIKQVDPVYWVIDGLDECDSPKALLYCLQNLAESKLPIKVMIMSRNTYEISSLVKRLSHSVSLSSIEENGMVNTEQDIRLLVQNELEYIRGSQTFKDDLLLKIVSRSEGNFLWTKLVLDEILDCHTEDSVKDVLAEVPDDMMLLYKRMEHNLVLSKKKSSPSLVASIRAILEWTTCAQRSLSVAELSQALKEELPGLLDLKRTITDICGQFILVDNEDTVAMVHHTAREYFTGMRGSRFFIDPRLTHKKLLSRMLQVLEAPALPLKLKQSQHVLRTKEPFVFYAAINWSYHLEHCCTATSHIEVLQLLVGFFRSSALLSWIHTLALVGRLEMLAKTSKALSSFTGRTPQIHSCEDLDYVDSCANDLLNIVGKFGHNIGKDPMVMYDIVPAFCPANSIVHKQFYDPQSSKIRVHGANKTGWNDRIGRFGLPNDAEAWNITCAGTLITVLGPDGVITLWNAIDFSEVGMITHGEPVTATALSDNGQKLATYGLATTKLWAIPAGKLLSSTQNPANIKAVSLAFGDNDGTLWVSGDDNVVRHTQLEFLGQGWQVPHPQMLRDNHRIVGAITSSPTCVAFDGDRRYMGASYRGSPLSVWRLEDGKHVKICKRAKTFQPGGMPQASASWASVKRFTWNPVTGHLLGIYADGCVFKWHPITNENVEEQQAADEIAASPNGLLFVTSSSNGSVLIWDFARFKVICKLSLEDLVTALAFSPDSRRIYDVRGGWVTAWEPSCLTSSLAGDEVTEISEAANTELVTTLSPAPDGRTYCVGYEDGRCLLFERGRWQGTILARFYNHLDITHAVWSRDGRFVAVADLAGEIQVKAIIPSPTEELEIVPLPNPQIDLDTYSIEELLFSSDCKRLFVASKKNAFVCSIENGTLVAQASLEHEQPRKWLCYSNQEVILSFGEFGVEYYTWDTLVSCSLLSFDDDLQPIELMANRETDPETVFGMGELRNSLTENFSNKCFRVEKVMMSQDKKHALYFQSRVGDADDSDTTLELFIFPGPELVRQASYLSSSLSYVWHSRVQREVVALIKVPLGVLPSGRTVFIDNDLWICSFQLDDPFGIVNTETLVQRLYFIPRDWVYNRSLSLCSMTEDGTLFWPRDGFVDLIECDIDEICMG